MYLYVENSFPCSRLRPQTVVCVWCAVCIMRHARALAWCREPERVVCRVLVQPNIHQ